MKNRKSAFTHGQSQENRNKSSNSDPDTSDDNYIENDGENESPTPKILLTTTREGTPPTLRSLNLPSKTREREKRKIEKLPDAQNKTPPPKQWKSKGRRIAKQPIIAEFITLIPPQRRSDVRATLSDINGQKYTILRGAYRLLCVKRGNGHYIINYDGTLTPYRRSYSDKARKSSPYDETYSEYSTSLAALKELDIVGYIKIHEGFQLAVNTRPGIRIINQNGDLFEPDSEYELIDTNAKLFDMTKNLSDRHQVLKRISKNWEAYNGQRGNVNIPLFDIQD